MWRRTAVMVVAAIVVAGALWASQALAQQPPERGGERGRRGGPPGAEEARRRMDPEQMRQRMEEFRQRMSDRLREQLGATEDEWKILEPRIQKVQDLMRQGRGGFRGRGYMPGGGGRFGRDRGRGPREGQTPEGAPEEDQPDIVKKTEALRSLLEDETSSASSIKAALDALRAARERAQQELAAARNELREVITARQEAQLVLMGILD